MTTLVSIFLLTFTITGLRAQDSLSCTLEYKIEVSGDSARKFCWLFIKALRCSNVYTKLAMDKGIQGRVLVSFAISDSCEMYDLKIIQGLGYGLDEKALQMLGIIGEDIKRTRDQCCAFRGTIPITFKID